MTLTRSFFTTLLLFLFSVSCFAQQKGTGSIKGKVRAEKGSAAGVAVILRRGEQEVTRVSTNSKGDFVIARITPGTYALTFRKPGLAVASIEKLEVTAGKTHSLKDLILSIDEGSLAFIRGSVFNEAGLSVPGARVDLLRIVSENSTAKFDSRITGETGEFVFRLLPDKANYRVVMKADGAETISKDVEVDGAAIYRVALTYKRNPK